MVREQEATTIFQSKSRMHEPRILVVEPDSDVAGLIEEGLHGAGHSNDAGMSATFNGRASDDDAASATPIPTRSRHSAPTVIGSLQALHNSELSSFDVIICAVNLPDGSGLDALAYIRGMRSDLPVILAGEPGDASLAVEAIRAGAMDFLVNTPNELRMLPLSVEKCLAHQRIKHDNERLQADLSRSLSELALKNQQLQSMIHQLETMARTDDLTGLYNRRWLNLMLERAWAEAIRNGRPVGFMMIDLDGFKSINDSVGHQGGDQLLQLAAKVIEANCRQVDVAARYGGDEFSVLMPNTEAEDALKVADRILQEFDYAVRHKDFGVSELTMSVGVSHVNLSQPANADRLISHADEALYASKSSGKHRILVYTDNGIISDEQAMNTR